LQEEINVKLLELKFNSEVIMEKNKNDYNMNNTLNDIGIVGETEVKQKKKVFL
jgi:hypothetical protein